MTMDRKMTKTKEIWIVIAVVVASLVIGLLVRQASSNAAQQQRMQDQQQHCRQLFDSGVSTDSPQYNADC
jgi:uncharacterized membrane-anchored protein YhcB (DUF1043 family)